MSSPLVCQPLAGLQQLARLQQPRRRAPLAPAPHVLLGLRWQQLTPPPYDAGGRRRAVLCEAGGPRLDAFDPDTYAEDPEDDDDYSYGGFGEAASSIAGAAVAAASGPASGNPRSSSRSRSSRSSGVVTDQKEGGQQHTTALGRGYSLMLLFGAALSRLLSRLHTAVLATGRVAWQLGGEALHGLPKVAVRAKDKAAESLSRSAAAKKVEKWQKKLEAVQQELPEDLWGKVMWVWDRPDVQKLRLTISMANFSIRLPALVALVATQIGLLSTSLSLPMLAPLLLGTGMLLRSIRTNASLVFPRIGLLVVLLWLLWFANSVIQNTVAYLRKQGAIDQRMADNINSAAELTVLVTAGIILLSMLGVNVSALLLPAGVAVAIAAKDLSHNFLAGFFLMVVQPFRLGDRVGVTLAAGSPGGFGGGGSWFEGVCEKVDLRYTALRQGKRRLMVPNSAFLQQPFMILEDVPAGSGGGMGAPPEAEPQGAVGPVSAVGYQPFITHDGRHVWQAYVNGAPVHQELAHEAVPPAASSPSAAPAAPAPAAAGRPPHGADAAPQQQQQQQQPYAEAQQQAASLPSPQQQQQQVGMPHSQQPPLQHQPTAPGSVFYTMAPPPGSYSGIAPPGGYHLYPRSHPLPPQTFS